MLDIYLTLCLIYTIIELILWMPKFMDYRLDKSKFKDLFQVYDLGMILFPVTLLTIVALSLLIFIISIIDNIAENKDKYSCLLTKKIFK
jgi:hypothetical protein